MTNDNSIIAKVTGNTRRGSGSFIIQSESTLYGLPLMIKSIIHSVTVAQFGFCAESDSVSCWGFSLEERTRFLSNY